MYILRKVLGCNTALRQSLIKEWLFKQAVAIPLATFTCLPYNSTVSLSAAPLMSTTAYWGVPAVTAPLVPSEPPVPPVPALPPQPPPPPSQPPFEPPGAKALPTDKTKKAKKDKVSIGILHNVSKEGSRYILGGKSVLISIIFIIKSTIYKLWKSS